MYVSEYSEQKNNKKKRPIEIVGLYMMQLITTKHIDAPIRRITFNDAPKKTIASHNNCKNNTFRININTPLARLSFFESNRTITL